MKPLVEGVLEEMFSNLINYLILFSGHQSQFATETCTQPYKDKFCHPGCFDMFYGRLF